MSSLAEILQAFRADVALLKQYNDQFKISEAEEIVRKYPNFAPRDIEFQTQKARLWFSKSDFAAAIQAFESILTLGPPNALTIAMYADSLANSDRRKEAINVLKNGLEHLPGDETLLMRLLKFVLAENGLEAAIAVVSDTITKAPGGKRPDKAIDALRQKAMSLYTMEEIEAADKNNLLQLKGVTSEQTGYNLKTVFSRFEPIGGNCEFGFVQRNVGVEPLSLFRWTSVTVEHLISLLSANLEDYDQPDGYSLRGEFGIEYMLFESRYKTITHTGVNLSDLTPEEFLERAIRKQTFLKRKFLDDARRGEKIFVYKSDKMLDEAEWKPVEEQLVRLGVRHCLFVMHSPDAALAGTIRRISDTSAIGFISDFHPRTKFDEWRRIGVAAHDLFLGTA